MNERPSRNYPGAAFRVAVAVVAALSLLPVADWIPGDPGSGLEAPYWPMYVLWLVGSLVLAALAWGGVKLFSRGGAEAPGGKGRGRRRRRKARTTEESAGGGEGDGPAWRSALTRGWGPVILLFVAPALLYGWVARDVFDARPLHEDALTQAFQARIFAGGELSAPEPEHGRFFSSSLVIDHDGRTFSQFPPGWSALLAVGLLLGSGWIVAPLCGGLAVYALFRLLRENGESDVTSFGAAAVLALSPWIVLNAATWMSHVPTLCFILLGSAALVRSRREPSSGLWAALGGAGLGVATMIRPLEGVAFGIPATVWVLARGWKDPSARRALGGFAAGGAFTVGLLLAYNGVMHGSPTLFGFELQWGPEHRLGFHEAPWGPPHTFLRGVQLVNGYLIALQFLFFDAPAPSLALALAALLMARRLDAVDRYLLAGCGLILLGYLAFWGEGHHLGPRYLIPLAPVVALWTVRFGTLLGERTGRADLRRWGFGLVLLLVVSGWIFGMPNRWFVHSQRDPLRRVSPAALQSDEARDALVFVPAPWSLQVLSRLWDTGMSRQQAQWFYYRVGLCKLDVALSQLEDRGVDDPDEVVAALRPLAVDSASMVLDMRTGSPGDPYTGLQQTDSAAVGSCALRQFLEEEQGGYKILTFQAMLGPTWTGEGAIVARDLHEDNRILLEAHPDREAYYLKPSWMSGRIINFVLEPLKADSVERVWGRFEELQEQATVF